MYRADNIKRPTHNTSSFLSSNRRNSGYKQTHQGNKYIGIEKRVEMNVDSLDSYGNELFPELVKRVDNNENGVSSTNWKDVLDTTQEDNSVKDSDYIINVNNAKYWDGANWIGPILIRGLKNVSSPWNKYTILSNLHEGCGDDLYLIDTIEYSRDGINWYSSWEETFTATQLEKQAFQDEMYEMNERRKLCNENYERIERESYRYYNEIGEMDDYAKAKEERLKYEMYESQFDEEIDELYNDIEMESYEEEDDEYLESDYN